MRTPSLAAVMLLTGCATTSFEAPAPTLYTYSPEQQERAADEISAIPAPCITCQMMQDYAAVRAEIRAILGE